MSHSDILITFFDRLLSESSISAELMRLGPEGLSEVNCNGHVEVDQRQPPWRDEDQHNGNAEPSEKCAGQEEQLKDSVHPVCNGVDSADLKELDTETKGREGHSSGVTERYQHAGLEEGVLEHSILQEDCPYRTEESLRNGQSAKSLNLSATRFWRSLLRLGC